MTNRYSRQELVLGKESTAQLKKSSIAIVGVGALGTVAAELLCRSGVGKLILIDRDIVEESNLQRQLLYKESDRNKTKVAAAKERLQEINSDCKIETHPISLNSKNISILKKPHLILDCTDNLQTRFLINDYCKKNKLVWIYAAAIKTKGYVMPIFPDGPCLQCFLQEAHLETCETAGVLNTTTALIAALQANLALKILTKKIISSKLYFCDLDNYKIHTLTIKKAPSCPCCHKIYRCLNKNEEPLFIKFCSSGRYQIINKTIDIQEIKKRWKKITKVTEDHETLSIKNITLFKDGRALIKANSESEALSIYSRYIGN